jgi:hypothetical protein
MILSEGTVVMHCSHIHLRSYNLIHGKQGQVQYIDGILPSLNAVPVVTVALKQQFHENYDSLQGQMFHKHFLYVRWWFPH